MPYSRFERRPLQRSFSIVNTNEVVLHEFRLFRRNPDLVLVDTQVIAQSPACLLVAGMGDTLSTWFEAKTCVEGGVRNMRGGASTRSALALAQLCYRTLLEDGADALVALRIKSVTGDLKRIAEVNTLLSGLGFESSALAAHAVHNGLTAVPETRPYLYGEKVAFGVLVQLVLDGQPHSIIEEVLRFSTFVGLPVILAEIGLQQMMPDMLERVAIRSTVKGETINIEPFGVTPEMVADAIRAANAMDHEW